MDEKTVQLTIDNRQVEAEAGASVLEAAQKAGIEIPTLCWYKGIEPYGACRLCLVEINRRGWDDDWTNITASCTLPVEDGLRVETQSAKVRALRQSVIQLLLARCSESSRSGTGFQPVDEHGQDAHATLLKMAERLGVAPDERLVKNDKECILCGLCVRACADVAGTQVIDFHHRGIHRDIGPAFGGASEQCLTCGACQSVCPTGIIDLKLFSKHGERPATSVYEKGLARRRAIHLPFLQAVPRAPLIDPTMCLQLNREQCGLCEKACEAGAIDYSQQPTEEKIDVGAVILAPGFCETDAGRASALGYGRYPNVVTSIEFERILSAGGPTRGHVVRPLDNMRPRRVAFIQCVNSRNMTDRGREYCSSVCCTYAIKQVLVAREHDPAIAATMFVMDVRTFGKDFDKYYDRARQGGMRVVRSAVSGVEQVPETGNLLLHFVGDDDRTHTEEFDMVVLSVGMQPARDAAELAKAAGVELNENGFCATAIEDPLRTSRDGVFTCGVFGGPKDIPESVTEASGAASCAASLLADARGTRVVPKSSPPERNVVGIEPRVGVFICHCGINIAGVVDVADVARYASDLRDVVFCETNLYTCSQDSQELIREIIDRYQLNRLVVASCSPRTHEPLFQETARQAGLNRHLVEMANIRDQCSWVHAGDPRGATEKAKDLVRMAVARARLAQPLDAEMLPVTQKATVVGGGLAGMTAALAIADSGFDVFLVEKEKRLGGNLRRLGRTAEGIEPHLLLAELEEKITDHERIDVFTETEIEAVEGFVGNYKTTLRRRPDEREKTQEHGQDVRATTEIEHGVAVIAVGGDESRPAEYLYGEDERVVTQLEFEEELERAGAQESKKGTGKTCRAIAERRRPMPVPPDCIVMIQCVGSRETEHPYCSRVCCVAAVNNALRARARYPDAQIFILYRDMRTYGFYEKYYREAREKGIVFVRYDEANKPQVTLEQVDRQDLSGHSRTATADACATQLRVEVDDPVLGSKLVLHPDRLILSARIDPVGDNETIAQLFKVPLNEDRFFLEAHVKLRPVDFATDGVFVAGLAHGPKPIRGTIAQARAAAGRALTILARDQIEAPATVAYVLPHRCMACGQCETLCAFGAIAIDSEAGVARVNEALCKGCGACAGSCRSDAIVVRGCTDEQIWSMIESFAATK